MNELLIYGDIGEGNITADGVRQQLSTMNGDVSVRIHSRGGSVFEGVLIHNELIKYDKGIVTTIVEGLAASIASYIARAGKIRKAHDNSTLMIHNAWTYTYGNGNELRKTADILDGLSSIIAKGYMAITGKSREVIIQEMDKESYYFGSEILDFGFCHEIISTDNETSKDEAIALSRESFKACCKKTIENFNPDEFVQAVAKLTKDGVLETVEDKEPAVVLDCTKQEQRDRELQILKMEIGL